MRHSFRPGMSDHRSRPVSSRLPAVPRIFSCLAAILAFALPGFAQHAKVDRYYAKVDRYAKIDNYAKVDSGGSPTSTGSPSGFRNLPVPPTPRERSRNGLPSSVPTSAGPAAKSSKESTGHELDQLAKHSSSSLNSKASHENGKTAGARPLEASERSGQGSGINFSSAHQQGQHAAAASSAPAKRHR